MSAGDICFPSGPFLAIAEIARRAIEDAVSKPARIASNMRPHCSYKIIATYRIQIERRQDTSVRNHSSTRVMDLRIRYLPWSVHEMDDGSQNPHHQHIIVVPPIGRVYIVRGLIFAICKTMYIPLGSLSTSSISDDGSGRVGSYVFTS